MVPPLLTAKIVAPSTNARVQKSAEPSTPHDLKPLFFLAWLLCAIFYFFQYAVRSAPGIMQQELTSAWGGNHIGAMISAYYVAYAVMALVAGVLLARYGPRHTIPYGIAVVGIGCLIFAQGSEAAGMAGFVLQAIGAIFAFIGSSYVAARYLPARMLAMFIGFTQCLGMAGAAFGSKPVHMAIDPAGSFQIAWQYIWIAFACAGFVLAVATWIIMPSEQGDSPSHHGPLSLASLLHPFKIVFGNVQSWLAGIVGGLLFLPTTIGALVWATSFLHAGENMPMAAAATDASMVPIGWVIGCPLLGYIADKIGRRKPVLIVGELIMLGAGLTAIYVPPGTLPPFSVALVLGIASGAAMIPFSMMKETNPSQVKGTAAGIMNFLVFVTTGIMSPFISRLMVPQGTPLTLHEFQDGFLPLVGGVVVAIVLSFFIHETGLATKASKAPKGSIAIPRAAAT
ncbi:MFS transporter [Rhodoplanes sp. Z2-YC6860]|uniref:MFS transporter n=1 Tax=Rhodoplanes sp. Z2-YC6860 TaxID=674703 RepID=UPI00078C20C9|nr:MFS transporter [Rhodoplanes sp. Z2-YC6860]AMN39722.1 major facilitator transporter [Rhodoplanes sp. Z2-YC6860]